MLEAFRTIMLMSYIVGMAGFVFGIFGALRTAATKLPVPCGDHEYYGLFPCDIGPKLYSFDGWGKKLAKIVIYGLIAAFFFACWWVSLRFTYFAGDPWFAWTANPGLWVGAVVHGVALTAITAVFVRRAVTGANKFASTNI
jgi:hypothetical protein